MNTKWYILQTDKNVDTTLLHLHDETCHGPFFSPRDSLLIAVMNSVTSILAGFAIFSIVGYMAHETGQDVDSVVSQGKL